MLKRIIALLLCFSVIFICFAIPENEEIEQLDGICGVDISKWNGKVDFAKMKRKGVDFAILRVHSVEADPTFEQNYNNAVKHSMPVGAYNYMYATTKEEAEQEAYASLEVLGGRKLEYPYFLDAEDDILKKLGKNKLTELCLIEMEIFARSGYNVGFYSNLSFLNKYVDKEQFGDYVLWVAKWTQYSSSETYLFSVQDVKASNRPQCDIWQWSDSGRGSYYGVQSERLDLNYSYIDFEKEPGYKRSVDPSSYFEPNTNINAGSSEMSICWLQAALFQLGYRTTVDGIFSDYTLSLIEQFQKDHSVKKTGLADENTIEAIKTALNEIT